MNKERLFCRNTLYVMSVMLLLGLPMAVRAQNLQPEPAPQPPVSPARFRFQYAAKFLCTANIPGTSQTTASVLPGSYQTVVNMHNPNRQPTRLRKKIAVASPVSQTSEFFVDRLAPDQAVKVDCEQIGRDFGMGFVHGAEGFLVIESVQSLDVTAITTAGKVGGEVEGLAVQHVQEREVP